MMMRRAAALVLVIAAAIAAVSTMAVAGPPTTHPPLELLGKPRFAFPPPPRELDGRGYDCIDVILDLKLDFDARTIIATARHTIEATRALDIVQMDLTDSLRVDGVWRGATPLRFEHRTRTLTISFDAPLAAGSRAEITIAYRGHPPREGFLGFSFERRHGVPAAYTISEPKSASSWWPCKDVPNDKLLATVAIDIPDTLYAGSNGRLIANEATGPGRRRMTWREGYPIAPYLVSIACTNYAVFGDVHKGPGEGEALPILYLAYPEHRGLAAASWAHTPEMIRTFEDRFGPYPFPSEKYGMAEFSWGGGMENQTLTSYGEYLVDGTDENDWVIAHELAHQWWGDDVTCATWEDIWLNEGFASYCEALWYESVGGIEAYRDWIRRMWWPDFPGPIVPPIYDFGGTVYFKGAWVLHMLRGVLGEQTFFAGMREYRRRHAYGNATTEDLIQAFEESSGRDLRWFFDRWVYGTGQPTYVMTWSSVARPDGSWLRVRIEQGQAEPTFRMPIEIEIRDEQGAYSRVLQDSLRIQEFLVPVRLAPTRVRLDPDDWILKDAVGGSDAPNPGGKVRLILGLPYPCPGRPPIRIPILGGAQPNWITIYDVSGQMITTIRPSIGQPFLTWDGRDGRGREARSGLYLARPSSRGNPIRLWVVR